MITKDTLKQFYNQYKCNLDKENALLEGLTHADNEEAWINKIKQKSTVMRQLYIENEGLLSTYVRPFIEGRIDLNDELADTFLDEITEIDDQGYFDNAAMTDICELLAEYYETNGTIENHIQTLNLLGKFYNSVYSKEDGLKAISYFETICSYSNRYFEIKDFATRKRILNSFYNKPIVKFNFNLAEIDELRKDVNEAISFWTNPKVRELDESQYDFDGIIRELKYDIYGGYVLGKDKDKISRDVVIEAKDILYDLYKEALENNPDIYEMPDEIYCNYNRCLFFLDEISCTEFIDNMVAFCEHSLEKDSYESEKLFIDSRLFQIITRQIPVIIENLNIYGKDYHGDQTLRKRYIDKYIKLIRELPKTDHSSFVNDVIGRTLFNFMELVASGEGDYNTLLNIAISRDDITMIHSRVVSQVATRLIKYVIENRPELLIGSLKCKNTVDVLEKQNEIYSYVSEAAMIFDIGKLQIADIVTKQTRNLTDREKNSIKEHPESGVNLIEKIAYFDKYQDVILGHHKSYDGTLGYPETFDNTTSPYRFFIDLIHLSDSICACTDFIGRSYRKPKRFKECMKELLLGKGTYYNPELVELLEKDSSLQEEIRTIVSVNRIHTYYETYGITMANSENNVLDWYSHIGELQDEKDRLLSDLYESSRENHDFVQALVKQSLLTLYVDLTSGNYRIFSRGNNVLFPELNDGNYQDFLRFYLSETFLENEKDSLRYKFSIAELTHTLVNATNNYEFEVQMRVNEEYKWVRIQCLNLNGENRVPKKMAMIFTDVTDIHNRNDRMEIALKEAYKTALEANQSKSSFLSNMSHDIRTPMNAIVNIARLMKHELNDPEILNDHLDKILESSELLLGIVNDVLDMSKIESGKTFMISEEVELSSLIKQINNVIRPQAEEKYQTLNIVVKDIQFDCIKTDSTRLYQLLSNILTNAIKYTHKNGQIDFTITGLSPRTKDYECIEFKVKDNGIGISSDYLTKIFEPFTRQENSMTSKIQGTGLGMAITKNIVDLMGGTINVKSEVGVGSTFTVVLEFPIIYKTQDTVEQKKEGIQDQNESILKDMHFLCAEDNELNAEVLKLLLQNVGATAVIYENGQEIVEAFSKSNKGEFDAILMDVQMPVMNGYDATKEIRKLDHPEAKSIPIIAMTANAFSEDIQNALNVGMNAHLSKPLDMQKLEIIIKKLNHTKR